MTDADAAAAALMDARRVQAEIVEKSQCPPAMHLVFGGLMGALVAAQGGSASVVFGVEGVVMLAAVILFLRTRRRLGFFVNGYRRGRTRWAVAALLLVFLPAMALAAWCKLERGLTWPALALGALTFVAGTAASWGWRRLYQSELAAGPANAA